MSTAVAELTTRREPAGHEKPMPSTMLLPSGVVRKIKVNRKALLNARWASDPAEIWTVEGPDHPAANYRDVQIHGSVNLRQKHGVDADGCSEVSAYIETDAALTLS